MKSAQQRQHRPIPVEPQIVTVFHPIGGLDRDEPRLLPVPAPPRRRMKAAEIPLPPRLDGRGNLADLSCETGNGDAQTTTGFQKLRDGPEIEVVGSEILIGIETDDGIE